MKYISVAIDGPAAAGKSTVAKQVAHILGFTYIDTGAMYRAFTYYALQHSVDTKSEDACNAIIDQVHVKLLANGKVMCNKIDVTTQIRLPEVSAHVSYIASYKNIRLALVKQQRAMAKSSNVVMDGRDIGTYVLPDAQIKIFQIASVETRAIRRYEENLSKNIPSTLASVEQDLRSRDYIDSHRDFAPLKPAPDSVLIDTSYMSVEEVVNRIVAIIRQKLEVINND